MATLIRAIRLDLRAICTSSWFPCGKGGTTVLRPITKYTKSVRVWHRINVGFDEVAYSSASDAQLWSGPVSLGGLHQLQMDENMGCKRVCKPCDVCMKAYTDCQALGRNRC